VNQEERRKEKGSEGPKKETEEETWERLDILNKEIMQHK